MSEIKKQIQDKFHIKDDLLEGITAEELIITLQANGVKLTREEIENVLNDLIIIRVRECKYNLIKNLEEIIKQTKR